MIFTCETCWAEQNVKKLSHIYLPDKDSTMLSTIRQEEIQVEM